MKFQWLRSILWMSTLQVVKGKSLPLGGMTIIASGDFLQLPSVMGRAPF